MHLKRLKNSLFRALSFLACAGLSLSKGDGGQPNWPRPQQGWNSGGGQTKGPLGGWDDEVSNPWGGWKLEDSIPGVPGQSYPNYDKIPETSFDCRRQKDPGYYGDLESQCQVFHICQAGGRQNSFLCPVGTIFNQESFVCDWWFNVNCGETAAHYDRNGNLFRGSDIGIDGSKIKRKGQQGNSKGSDQPPAIGIPTWSPQGVDDNWGMKGSMNQGGQQGTWGNQGSSNKGSSGQGRLNPNAGTQRGHNKGTSGQGSFNPNVGGQGGNNKGSTSGNSGANDWNRGGNTGIQNRGGQKGFGMAGNANAGWGRQGSNQVSPGRNKGMVNNQIRQGRGVANGNFGQKGNFPGGNNQMQMQRRSGLVPNNKGGRRAQIGQGGNNMKAGNVGSGGNFGMGNQRTKGSARRTDSNRNLNANGWSMGVQNFQVSSHEKGEAFSNGRNARGEPSSFQDDNAWQGPGVNDNFHPDGQFKGEDGNNNWNNGGANQWGNRIAEFRSGYENNNMGGHSNWNADYEGSFGNSFSFNEKGSYEGQAGENDYDYVWNS